MNGLALEIGVHKPFNRMGWGYHTGMKTNIGVGVAIAALVVVVLAWWFVRGSGGTETPVPDATQETVTQNVGASVPDVNPINKTNPFADIKTNPFE